MMFGLRESFSYVECSACSSLSLVDVPDDLSRFYPPGYYSFAAPVPPPPSGIDGAARRVRSELMLRAAPWLAERVFRAGRCPKFLWWLSGLGLSTRSRVLDLGSGRGTLLGQMRAEGFTDLTGADPYLDADASLANGVQLKRCGIEEVRGQFDLVMMNHSFEHVPDAVNALRQARRLLDPGGTVLVRVPVADSYAFDVYGPEWVQLDAPRHILVPTSSGMAEVAARADMDIVRSFRDSSAFQFWGSEQYRRDLPLRDPASYAEDPSVLSPELLRDWKAQAALLNRRGRGDSAGFVLRPRPTPEAPGAPTPPRNAHVSNPVLPLVSAPGRPGRRASSA